MENLCDGVGEIGVNGEVYCVNGVFGLLDGGLLGGLYFLV